MRKKLALLAVLAAVFIISSCSREGFEESLNRGGETDGDTSPSSQQQEESSEEDYIFDLSSDEYEEGKGFYYYALPVAVDEKAEEAARKIYDTLEGIVTSLEAEVAAGREYESFTVYDAITKNDGKIFSVMYEVEFSPSEGEDERYILGLAFDAVTGDRLAIDELIDTGTLITLILDGQASEISGRDEELNAKRREYLSDEGEDALLDRLTAEGGTDVLLDASFYVDGSKLVAVFGGGQELGGSIEVSVDL